MSAVARQIVRIDQELCDGCGVCVSPCAGGAIAIVDGKARVLQEELCDGAGSCLDVCPTGALSIELREAAPYAENGTPGHPGAEHDDVCVEQRCFQCGTSENEAPLLSVRIEGRVTWCCTRCLPRLIHG